MAEVITRRVTGYISDTEEGLGAAIEHLGEIDRARCRDAVEGRFSAAAARLL